MEIEDINEKEAVKQLREQIINSGHYARVEIIVDKDSEIPYCETNFIHANPYIVMKLLKLLDATRDLIIEKDPMLKMYSLIFGTKEGGTIDMNE